MKQNKSENIWSQLSFLLVIHSLFLSISFASVITNTGKIDFDINNDDHLEMKLNATGLGIGKNLTPTANLHVEGNAILSEQLNLGGSSLGTTTLQVTGSMGLSLEHFTSDGNIGDHSIVLADTSSGNYSLTLPSASTCPGRLIKIKKTVTNYDLEIKTTDRIEHFFKALTLPSDNNLMPYVNLVSYSGNWLILSKSGIVFPSIFGIGSADGTDGISGAIRFNETNDFGDSSFHIKNNGLAANTRKGFLRFDSSDIDFTPDYAEVVLYVSLLDSTIGSNDQTFHLYGVTDESLDNWSTGSANWSNAPANDTTSPYEADLTKSDHIQSISLNYNGDKPADVGSHLRFSGDNLSTFLDSDTNGLVTFIIGRNGGSSTEDLLFAGDTNSTYNPPSLHAQVRSTAFATVVNTESVAINDGNPSTFLEDNPYNHSFDAGDADKLIVHVISEGGSGAPLTYNGVALTKAFSNSVSNIWYLDNPYTGGPANLTFDGTGQGTVNGLGLGIVSLKGMAPGPPTVTSSSSGNTVSVTPLDGNGFAFVVANRNSTSGEDLMFPVTQVSGGVNMGSHSGASGYQHLAFPFQVTFRARTAESMKVAVFATNVTQ